MGEFDPAKNQQEISKKSPRVLKAMMLDDLYGTIELIIDRIKNDEYFEDGGYVDDWIREDLIVLIDKSCKWHERWEQQKNSKRIAKNQKRKINPFLNDPFEDEEL